MTRAPLLALTCSLVLLPACGGTATGTGGGGSGGGTTTTTGTGGDGGAGASGGTTATGGSGGTGASGGSGGSGGNGGMAAGGSGAGGSTTTESTTTSASTTSSTTSAEMCDPQDPTTCPEGTGCVCGGPGALLQCKCGAYCSADADCGSADLICCGGSPGQQGICTDACTCYCD
jgi:hypothetical protein